MFPIKIDTGLDTSIDHGYKVASNPDKKVVWYLI